MWLTAKNPSSRVIDSLCDQTRGGNIALAGLYCDFLSEQEDTITNMIGTILKQLVGRGGIPSDVREVFLAGKRKFGGRGPLLVDLMQMLRTTIVSLPQVFICIDGLDECLREHLPDLLQSLRDLVRESPGTRILLTGRPHDGAAIQRYFGEVITIPIGLNPDEIRNYLDMRLDGDGEPDVMDNNLRADIVGTILDKMSDM